MKFIYCLLVLFLSCHAEPIYLISYERDWSELNDKIQTQFMNVLREEQFGLDNWKQYDWSYDEENKVLYDRCGGSLAHLGQVDYYDKKYKNAFYLYLVHENTEYFCDLTQRLVLKTGAILQGCKAPETWYYKVPILDTEEDN